MTRYISLNAFTPSLLELKLLGSSWSITDAYNKFDYDVTEFACKYPCELHRAN
jgi:hypothetical protein